MFGRRAPRALGGRSASAMRDLDMVRGHYDGCFFMKLGNSMMAGRRADDFLITGPSDECDKLVDLMGERLEAHQESGVQVEKVEGGCASSGMSSLIDDILKELGLERAKPSMLPETKNDMHMESDEVKLDAVGH
eukprot:9220692-Pyramimonas_sp.AAC.1